MPLKNINEDYLTKEIETKTKGTIFVIDGFEDYKDKDFRKIVKLADDRNFDKIVFYPLHESTLKRMKIEVTTKYFSRFDQLEYLISETNSLVPMSIDKLDGNRKKYTPLDFILNHLVGKHKKPHFVYLTKEIANKFSSYSSFENWIKDVRLIIQEDESIDLSKQLVKYLKRIEFV